LENWTALLVDPPGNFKIILMEKGKNEKKCSNLSIILQLPKIEKMPKPFNTKSKQQRKALVPTRNKGSHSLQSVDSPSLRH
jgi:hypothetical protein